MKKHQFILFLLLAAFGMPISAQNITGKVIDADGGGPLIGVTVKNLSNNNGTLSDDEGNFSLTGKDGNQLEVSYVGYTTQIVAAAQNFQITLTQVATNLDQVVVVGSRGRGRVAIETPVPVDVINLQQIASNTGRADLTSMLNYAAPSFNYNRQSGSDGADHVDLATLRGLGPDQSLVLINGKRRHQTAFVSVFGTRGRGNSGTDMNALPVAAIDRVEILRDGAAAQYGSDAIAGVINLILKKNTGELSVNAGYSAYYDQKFNPAFSNELKNYFVSENKLDGQIFNADMNYGIGLGKRGGFVNLTLNYQKVGKTFRQSLDTSELLTNPDAMYINNVRRAHGDASVDIFGGFVNAELPLNDNGLTLYGFGGYNAKNSDAYAFSRNFSSKPGRFPTDAGGNLIQVPDIIAQDPAGEYFYNPKIATEIRDASASIGIKGILANDWNWDLSNTIGRNSFHFFGEKTFNASLGDVTKNSFDDGGFTFLQNTVNLNFNKVYDWMEGFSLGAGAEYRIEQYTIFAGEEASYRNYDTSGVKATGSQGFPGYQPADEVNANRSATGIYLDGELDVTKRWLVGLAVRGENYSDFGFTTNVKAATRYKLTDNFNFRASASTGFRAPSLQQINFSSTFTTVQGGEISEVKIAPNDNAITKAAGIASLKQETSVNLSAGFTWKPISSLSITADVYQVQIKDRVVLSGQFSAEDTTLNSSLTNTLKQLDVGLAQFFANAVNTTNQGLDIVVDYNHRMKSSSLRFLLAANFQTMTIDKINVPASLNSTEDLRKTFLSDREQKFILASAPPMKLSLNIEYRKNKFNIGTRLTHFGEINLLGYGEDGLGIDPMVPKDDGNGTVPDSYTYGAKLVTDIYMGYQISKAISFTLGVDNILNVHPDLGQVNTAKYWAYNNETGGPWDAVQMGGNGTRMFVRLSGRF